MKTILVAITAFMLTGAFATAEEQNGGPSYSAESLIMMLSSDVACDLAYDKGAIERYIKHITDKKEHIPNLGPLVSFERDYVVKKMSANTLTAHCAQVRDIAKMYGFIK